MKSARFLTLCILSGPASILLSCKSPNPAAAPTVSAPVPPAAAVAMATPDPKPLLDGTYSNMKSIPGEGDVIGTEVTLSNSQGAALVVFQCAQGELPQPQQVAAEVSGATVRFKTRTNAQCPGASYLATIDGDTLALSIDAAATPAERLKRIAKPGDRP